MKQLIKINGPHIKLDQLLKLSGLLETGGQAKFAISNGLVKVNGDICLVKGKKLVFGDFVEYKTFCLEVAQNV